MAEQQGFFARLAQDPAVKDLVSKAGEYATAKGKDLASKKMPGPDEAEGIVEAGKNQAKREAAVPAIKGFFKGAWQKLTKGSKGGKRPINILETAMIGAPVELVWDEWLDFKEWPNFMKGPEKVDVGKEGDDGEDTTTWTAKVFIHRRQWKSTITEQVDYERLRWKSEAKKGQIDGMVAFSPAGENLTFCVLVLEYRPKGFFEQIGKLWRVQGRRARLDFKHFQRHVAMADQADALNRPTEDPDDQRADANGAGDGAGSPEQPDGAGDTGDTGDTGRTGEGGERGAGTDQEPAAASS